MKDGDICQIAEVVSDIESVMKHLYEDFGIGPWDIYEYGPEFVKDSIYRGNPNKQHYKLAVCWLGNVQYELMQPLDGYSIYNEFLEKTGDKDGLQHFKRYYRDCKKEIERLEKKGYSVIQSGRVGDDEFYYLSTDENIGCVIEIGNAGNIPEPLAHYPESN